MPNLSHKCLPEDPGKAYAVLADRNPAAATLACEYGPRFISDTDWSPLAQLVTLGIAAAGPDSGKDAARHGWVLHHHVSAALARGAARTVSGVYGPDQVEHTLACLPPGVSAAKRSAFATTLRRVSRRLVPAGQRPEPVKTARRATLAPYSTEELAALLDGAVTVPAPRWRARVTLAIALAGGAGLTNADCHALTTTSRMVDAAGVRVVVPSGTRARTVPVRHEFEQLLTAAWQAVLEHDHHRRASSETDGAELVVTRGHVGGWFEEVDWPEPVGMPDSRRLRATWTVLALAGGCSVPAYLQAAHITSTGTWHAPLRWVAPLGDDAYRVQLRGTAEPYVPSGRALDGQPWPAPMVPLADGGAR